MKIKHKLLLDKYGWYYQHEDSSICGLVACANVLKFYNKEIKPKKYEKICKKYFYDDLGLYHQDLLYILNDLNVVFNMGHFDIEYIKHSLDHGNPLMFDVLMLKVSKDLDLTHMIFVTKYKILNKKYYLFCTNIAEGGGSKWVKWSKLKKYSCKCGKKYFNKNFCIRLEGVL